MISAKNNQSKYCLSIILLTSIISSLLDDFKTMIGFVAWSPFVANMLTKNSLGRLKKGAAKQSRIKSIACHLRWLVRTRADIGLRPSGLVRSRTDIKLRPSAFVRTRIDFKLQTVGLVRSYKD